MEAPLGWEAGRRRGRDRPVAARSGNVGTSARSAAREKHHAGVCASGFGRGAGSRRVRSVYMTPFSAPFGGFCPRPGPLCKGRAHECWPPVSGAGFSGFARRADPPWARPGRKGFYAFPGKTPLRRTMPTHPPRPASLCAAQARPTRRPGLKRQGRSDALTLPPCRRRETIFRRPDAWGSASSPQAPRRPRLATTPRGVSAAGWRAL